MRKWQLPVGQIERHSKMLAERWNQADSWFNIDSRPATTQGEKTVYQRTTRHVHSQAWADAFHHRQKQAVVQSTRHRFVNWFCLCFGVCEPTILLIAIFPECVVKGSRFTLWGSGGVEVCSWTPFLCSQPSATVRNRLQPSATVRNRPRGRKLQKA